MSLKYPTPHIAATPDDIAKTVLMPGDPVRSEFIAKNTLDGAVLFNNVRGVRGYTGYWHGSRVSVMASGMGMPSMGIYSYELYNFFDIENIIRIGTAGTLSADIDLFDIIIGMGACTTSRYAEQYHLPGSFAPIADYGLLKQATATADAHGAKYYVGNLLSADVFYDDCPDDLMTWSRMGVLAVEMEAAALYMNAARAGKHALAICTVSDSLINHKAATIKERETGLTNMIEIALDTAASMDTAMAKDKGQS